MAVMTYTPLQARYDDPWRILVVCMLLNLTSRVQVRRVLDELFDRWPDPKSFLEAGEQDVRDLLLPLGMANQRYWRLRTMSAAYLRNGPPREYHDVLALHGCGTYAADAWEIFCKGNLDIEPEDRVLAEYVTGQRND